MEQMPCHNFSPGSEWNRLLHGLFFINMFVRFRLILDRGELMTKEQLDVSNLTAGTKSEDQNPQVSFSPNIKYAASDEFTKKYP